MVFVRTVLKQCVCCFKSISSRFFENVYLRKLAAIPVKRGQKAGNFLRPISSKIKAAKEKERRKRKSGEGERRKIEKKIVTLLLVI